MELFYSITVSWIQVIFHYRFKYQFNHGKKEKKKSNLIEFNLSEMHSRL